VSDILNSFLAFGKLFLLFFVMMNYFIVLY